MAGISYCTSTQLKIVRALFQVTRLLTLSAYVKILINVFSCTLLELPSKESQERMDIYRYHYLLMMQMPLQHVLSFVFSLEQRLCLSLYLS